MGPRRVILFLVLWLPCCYAFWLKIRNKPESSSSTRFLERVIALSTGVLMAIMRFFWPEFWHAAGFGLSRFIGACIDYGLFTLAVPFIFCFIFTVFQSFFLKKQYKPDWTGWTLFSLIPVMFVYAGKWGQEKNLLNLVLIPLLWSAAAFNFCLISEFFAKSPSVSRVAAAVLAAFLAMLLTSAVWWAFFASKLILGFAFLVCELLPALFFIIRRLFRKAPL